MRKLASVTAVLAAGTMVGFLAVRAEAFDIGSKVKEGVKEGVKAATKSVVEKEINKNLASKNCSFKPKTTELTCDIEDILSTVKLQKSIAEKSGFANDVDLYAEIGRGKDPKNPNLGSERADLIRNKLRHKISSWWDWYDNMIEGDQLKLHVKVE